MLDPDCEFCQIILGTEHARIVYEAADTLAFFPTEPATSGHTLLIPKQHIGDLWGLDEETALSLARSVLPLAHALRRALSPHGMNIINSAGHAAWQTVPHVHIHLVPRWENDHIGNIWPPETRWSETVKDELAEIVRNEVQRSGTS